MKKNYFIKNSYIIVIVAILLTNCSMQKKLSSQLYQMQKQECGDYKHLKTLEKNRNEAGIFDVYNLKNDTIYIIESYDNNLAGGFVRTSGTYWDNIKYCNSYEKVNNNKLVKYNHEAINRYIMYLVNQWDIEKIISESEQYQVIPTFEVYATRIIFIDSKPKIETICFNYFVNIKAEEEFYN